MAEEESRGVVEGRGEEACAEEAAVVDRKLRSGGSSGGVAEEGDVEAEGDEVGRRMLRARRSSDRKENLERRERAQRRAERALLRAVGEEVEVEGGEREAHRARREAEVRRRSVWQ